MRSNGDGGERFLARLGAGDAAAAGDSSDRGERDSGRESDAGSHGAPEPRKSSASGTNGKNGKDGPRPKTAARKPSKSLAPRARKSIAPVAAADSAPQVQAEAKDKVSRKAPARGDQRPSGAPKSKVPAPRASRPAPASKVARQPAASAAVPGATDAATPPSLAAQTTLRDHPLQKSLATTVRASVFPGSPSVPAATERDERRSGKADDDISIPPTSTDPHTDLDDRFFAEGEAAAHAEAYRSHHSANRVIGPAQSSRSGAAAHDDDAHHPVVAPERRRKLTNYVKTAVGFSALLCFAALVRVGIVHANANADHGFSSAFAGAQIVAAPPVAAAPVALPAAAAPAVQAAPAVAAPQNPPQNASESVTSPPAVGGDAPVTPAPAEAVSQATTPPKSAKEEKEAARRALERGKRKDAVEAAQRSVDLDATDAEAWLLLGSAQQDSGHWKEAHESFVSCTKEAKTGPIKECRMMLR